MLLNLYVKNLALIDELEIDFTDGLNILTGETGAGKSVLIGSVNLALGEKADASLIRDGADFALIEMTFHAADDTLAFLRAMDLPYEADNSVVLQRRIMPGRSACKVCGETVSLKQLRALAGHLIHIHGQNDQMMLLDKQEQRVILDTYIGEEFFSHKKRLAEAYSEMKKAQKAFAESDMDNAARQREMDLIRYELREIDDAGLREHEDDELEETFRRMEGARRTAEALSKACAYLEDDADSVSARVSQAVRALAGFGKTDPVAEGFYTQLSDIESLLSDVSREMRDALSETDYTDEDYNTVTGRLNQINRLKEKYAGANAGVTDVLRYREKREEELAALDDLDAHRARLQTEIETRRQEAFQAAEAVSALRVKYAKQLSSEMEKALADLNFQSVSFQVAVSPDKEALNENGFDRISYLISPNAGERMKALSDIASGGELSRIMLALNTVLANKQEAQAMIFDEIDAGISGKTAWKVAERLGALAASGQVICITHLAQIAAMADTHFMIYKEPSGSRVLLFCIPTPSAMF